jgi:hypothetical protein
VGGVTTSLGGVTTSVVDEASPTLVSATAPSGVAPTPGSVEPQAAVKTDTSAMHRSEEKNEEVFMIRVLLWGVARDLEGHARARDPRAVA